MYIAPAVSTSGLFALRSGPVLITGASGFVGTWLTRRLLSLGATVNTIMADWNPSSDFVRCGLVHEVTNHVGSIEDHAFLDKVIVEWGIVTVFHLAALSTEGVAFANPRVALEVNTRGAYNVLDACRRHSDLVKHVIVASSDKVYGDSAILPYTEDLPLIARNPYDVSKACADQIARAYHHSFGLPVIVGRFGNIYGGGDLNWCRLIPNTIRRLASGDRPVVRVPQHGSFSRDFLFVEDAVDAYLYMLGAAAKPNLCGEAFNFALGQSWPVEKVVRLIQQIMGRNGVEPSVTAAERREILNQHLSIEKAERLLAWRPKHTLEDGLVQTVRWYTDHLRRRDAAAHAKIGAPHENPVHVLQT